MYLADYHTHSCVSTDGSCSMSEMARAALDKGFQEICFTDHVDPVNWGETTLCPLPYDWEPLRREFAAAQAEMGDRIKLRLGIELDAMFDIGHTMQVLQGAPEFDFVIGSVHMLSREKMGGLDLYFFRPENEEQAHDGIRDYLDQVRQFAQWDGSYSVLGHLTLPLRYLNELQGFHLTFDDYEKEMEEIFRSLIERGRGIEVNTNRGNDPLPGEKWLRMYRDLGGRIITLGSDAHDTANIGCAIRQRQELLKQCGFEKFCTFEKMKPIWHKL